MHARNHPEQEGRGELHGALAHPDRFWSIDGENSSEGYWYERTGTHLHADGSVSTFEPFSSIRAELDEVPCGQ